MPDSITRLSYHRRISRGLVSVVRKTGAGLIMSSRNVECKDRRRERFRLNSFYSGWLIIIAFARKPARKKVPSLK